MRHRSVWANVAVAVAVFFFTGIVIGLLSLPAILAWDDEWGVTNASTRSTALMEVADWAAVVVAVGWWSVPVVRSVRRAVVYDAGTLTVRRTFVTQRVGVPTVDSVSCPFRRRADDSPRPCDSERELWLSDGGRVRATVPGRDDRAATAVAIRHRVTADVCAGSPDRGAWEGVPGAYPLGRRAWMGVVAVVVLGGVAAASGLTLRHSLQMVGIARAADARIDVVDAIVVSSRFDPGAEPHTNLVVRAPSADGPVSTEVSRPGQVNFENASTVQVSIDPDDPDNAELADRPPVNGGAVRLLAAAAAVVCAMATVGALALAAMHRRAFRAVVPSPRGARPAVADAPEVKRRAGGCA